MSVPSKTDSRSPHGPSWGPRRLTFFFLLDAARQEGDSLPAAVAFLTEQLRWLKQQSTPGADLYQQDYPLYTEVIGYGETATRLLSLSPCDAVPDLDFLHACTSVEQGRPFVEDALKLLQDSVEEELVKCGKDKGDSKPVVVFLSSGGDCGKKRVSEHVFKVRLDTLRKCAVVVVLFTSDKDNEGLITLVDDMVPLICHEGTDQQRQLRERLGSEIKRFHREDSASIQYRSPSGKLEKTRASELAHAAITLYRNDNIAAGDKGRESYEDLLTSLTEPVREKCSSITAEIERARSEAQKREEAKRETQERERREREREEAKREAREREAREREEAKRETRALEDAKREEARRETRERGEKKQRTTRTLRATIHSLGVPLKERGNAVRRWIALGWSGSCAWGAARVVRGKAAIRQLSVGWVICCSILVLLGVLLIPTWAYASRVLIVWPPWSREIGRELQPGSDGFVKATNYLTLLKLAGPVEGNVTVTTEAGVGGGSNFCDVSNVSLSGRITRIELPIIKCLKNPNGQSYSITGHVSVGCTNWQTVPTELQLRIQVGGDP